MCKMSLYIPIILYHPMSHDILLATETRKIIKQIVFILLYQPYTKQRYPLFYHSLNNDYLGEIISLLKNLYRTQLKKLCCDHMNF